MFGLPSTKLSAKISGKFYQNMHIEQNVPEMQHFFAPFHDQLLYDNISLNYLHDLTY